VPLDAGDRRLIVERRLAFDRDPDAFLAAWNDEQMTLTGKLRRARESVEALTPSPELLDFISRTVCEAGARSLRADLAVVRASRALAALDGVGEVTDDHVRTVLPLVLAHRVSQRRTRSQSSDQTAPRVETPRDDPSTTGQTDAGHPMPDRVFAARDVPAPRIVVHEGAGEAVGAGRADSGPERGPVLRARTAVEPRELALRASVVHAVTSTGSVALRRDDLHESVRAPETTTRYIFVVDSSGSHAIERRMQAVKGTVLGVLDRSVSRFDEIVLIVFRGTTATVLCQPTGDLDAVQRALEYVPTGGRTPLADALDVAGRYVTDRAVLVLVTDGRANVPRWTDDAWRDAVTAASAIACPALVVDSEIESHPSGRARELAEAIGGHHVALDDVSAQDVLRIARLESRPQPARDER